MVDIATVSVVSSAAVALGTLAVNFIGGERQRKHEADLEFEGRVWDRKSEALFSLMEECRYLVDSGLPLSEENRERYALDLSKSLDKLHDLRPAVDAFASTHCRTELSGLIEVMLASGVKHRYGNDAEHFFRMGFAEADAIKRAHWDAAENQAKSKAVEGFDPDLGDVRARAKRLLDAARESVRRPKD